MKHFFILLFGILLLSSCNKQEEKKPVAKEEVPAKTESKEFEMYEMSEMAALMEQMYVDNQRLKERIKNGDTIGKFPSHFLEIHKSAMTDESENDAFFKKQATGFINSQKLIYEDPKNAKEHFNAGVSACVACHQVKCAGPIPRIKKLFIE